MAQYKNQWQAGAQPRPPTGPPGLQYTTPLRPHPSSEGPYQREGGPHCNTQFQPHPQAVVPHPPTEVALRRQQQQSSVPQDSTPFQPRPLFDSRPNVPRCENPNPFQSRPSAPARQQGSNASLKTFSQADSSYQSPDSKPHPLFEAPPSRVPQQLRPAMDGGDRSRPGHLPTNVTRPSIRPAWPRPPHPGPAFVPHHYNQNMNQGSNDWEEEWEEEWEQDCNENSYEYQEDFTEDSVCEERFEDSRPQAEEFGRLDQGEERFDVRDEGLGRSDVPSGQGWSESRYDHERPGSYMGSDPMPEGVRDREMQTGRREWENTYGERQDCFRRGPDSKEFCPEVHDGDSSIGTPHRVEEAKTNSVTSRPPAFPAGVEDEKEGGEKEGEVTQCSATDSGQRDVQGSLDRGGPSRPTEHASGRSDRFRGSPPGEDHPERHSGHPDEPYPDRCYNDERYPGRPSEGYSGRRYAGHYSSHSDEPYSGRPDGHYPGRPDEQYIGRPDERYSGHSEEHYPPSGPRYHSNLSGHHDDGGGRHGFRNQEYDDSWREERSLREERSFRPPGRAFLLGKERDPFMLRTYAKKCHH